MVHGEAHLAGEGRLEGAVPGGDRAHGDRAGRQDGRLRWEQEGGESVDAEAAQVGEGDRRLRHVLGPQLSGAGPICEGAHRPVRLDGIAEVGVGHGGDDEPGPRAVHRQPDPDRVEGLRRPRLLVPPAVQLGVFAEGAGQRPHELGGPAAAVLAGGGAVELERAPQGELGDGRRSAHDVGGRPADGEPAGVVGLRCRGPLGGGRHGGGRGGGGRRRGPRAPRLDVGAHVGRGDLAPAAGGRDRGEIHSELAGHLPGGGRGGDDAARPVSGGGGRLLRLDDVGDRLGRRSRPGWRIVPERQAAEQVVGLGLDGGQHLTEGDGRPGLHEELGDRACERGLALHVDLVGRHLGDRLSLGDGVPGGDEPREDGRLLHGGGEGGQTDLTAAHAFISSFAAVSTSSVWGMVARSSSLA